MMAERLTPLKNNQSRRRLKASLFIVLIVGATAVYVAGVPNNPPGFYIDESSIAYNAHTIAQTGRDECGVPWPLYFRAFGEYKNPVYIYLLAALYHFFGPGIFVARLLSVTLGLMAAAVLGILTKEMTSQRRLGLIVGTITLFTPWFFELSRLVVEVALYPLALALFLLALYRAASSESWSLLNIVCLSVTLALLTYSYSIGRLLAPLLALGLIVFMTRKRLQSIVQTWVLYALTLVPLLLFNRRHPGALLERFRWTTYITPQSTPLNLVTEFIQHYAANLSPRNLLFTGDPNPAIHVPWMGSMLLGPALLVVGGVALVLVRQRREPWWRFMLYGVLVAIIPASLTRDQFPSLRLIAFPIFLLMFSIPALVWLLQAGQNQQTRRGILVAVLLLTALQAGIFQSKFHGSYQSSSVRREVFAAGYPQLFMTATAAGSPIYLSDQTSNPGYIHAYWYGTLRGFDVSQFVRLAHATDAPAGAIVITTEEKPAGGKVLAADGAFTAFVSGVTQVESSRPK